MFGGKKILVVGALSFSLTLLSETFNFWTVDFFCTEGGAKVLREFAGVFFTPFYLCGGGGVVVVGVGIRTLAAHGPPTIAGRYSWFTDGAAGVVAGAVSFRIVGSGYWRRSDRIPGLRSI